MSVRGNRKLLRHERSRVSGSSRFGRSLWTAGLGNHASGSSNPPRAARAGSRRHRWSSGSLEPVTTGLRPRSSSTRRCAYARATGSFSRRRPTRSRRLHPLSDRALEPEPTPVRGGRRREDRPGRDGTARLELEDVRTRQIAASAGFRVRRRSGRRLANPSFVRPVHRSLRSLRESRTA